VWTWGGCGWIWYSSAVRYTIDIWSRKNRHEDWGGWSTQKTKGPEYKWERRAWAWEGCGGVSYSSAVRYSTVIWSLKRRHEDCGGWGEKKTKGPESKWYRGVWTWEGCGGVYATLVPSDIYWSRVAWPG
jgi:hypothetical protein